MIHWFRNLLYGFSPAQFESSFGIEESIRRLKEGTARSVFSALFRQMAVGKVEKERVSLRRVIPFFHNAFHPYFIGHFEVQSGRAVLIGGFTLHWFTKAFMSFWFGFLALWTILAVAFVMTNEKYPWWFPLFGIGMFCLGTAFVRFGKWLSRNDVAWLSDVICIALCSPNRNPSKV